eukprot:1035867-Rhodomonas_salina.2
MRVGTPVLLVVLPLCDPGKTQIRLPDSRSDTEGSNSKRQFQGGTQPQDQEKFLSSARCAIGTSVLGDRRTTASPVWVYCVPLSTTDFVLRNDTESQRSRAVESEPPSDNPTERRAL